MDVTTMLRKSSLPSRLGQDFPQFTFATDLAFRWSSLENTIYYPENNDYNDQELLHELSHALLGHTDYTQDVELLRIESEAWEYAKKYLASNYRVTISQEEVESLLDTYRDWLHARSLCPVCHQNGLQTTTGTYQCLNCRCQWRANEAKLCMLRRYRL